MKRNIIKSVYVGIFVCLSALIVSCEEDFTDIGSNVISNTKFNTASVLEEVTLQNSTVERIQSDNITQQLGQYLLGVYSSPDYEKLEASIMSQVAITADLKVVDNFYGADTTVVTKIDTVFLKLPYQATLIENTSSGPILSLDSIIGDGTKPFNLNLYRSNTFINRFNPLDPSKVNRFFSDYVFEKTGTELNADVNYQFIPNENDTLLIVKRRLFNDNVYDQDTVKLITSGNNVPLPFARIPMDKEKFKEIFFDKYETGEFASQETFNNYFRGIILEATGDENSLVSFNLNSTNETFVPSIEVYYTNTVLRQGSTVIDTIKKRNSFPLTGFRVNTYKMENKVYPVNNEIIVQGAAGSEGNVTLFDQNKIDELRSKDWLINDATLTFYINQSADTTYAPERLYMYKSDEDPISPRLSQIKDAYSEIGFQGINGLLVRDSNGKKEKYVFKITDYVSDIISGETTYYPTLKLKTFNPTDLARTPTDTIFRKFSWNPKAVTLFNNDAANGDKKSVLKITYSEKKE